MAEKVNRSAHYQSIFNEKSFSHEMLDTFANEESVYKRLNPYSYDERVLELQDQLQTEFWRLLEENLTDRQLEIVNLLKKGKTQQEVAKALGINQSSITKSIHGNVDYSKKDKSVYGGIAAKMQRILEKDKRIQEIFRQIAELRDESWL
jgi:DNA-directed RNA polymerase specialized sigma subunit